MQYYATYKPAWYGKLGPSHMSPEYLISHRHVPFRHSPLPEQSSVQPPPNPDISRS